MPSWKKVITSGSAAALSSLNVTGGITGSSVLISGSTGTLFSSNVDTLVLTGSLLVTGSTVLSGSLNVSQGITGSLLGTASYATQALSASYAPSAGLTGGTANYIPLWTSTSAISSSAIYQSAGNVGIGTTSPIEKLHIVSTSGSAATYPIAIQNATGSIDTKVGIKFIAASATTRYAAIEGIQEDGNNSIALGFITGQGATITEKMRIVPGGNVGIGTTSPSEKLSVGGNINLLLGSGGTKIGFNVGTGFTAYGTSKAHYGLTYSNDTNPVILSGYDGVSLFTRGAERLTVSSSGNVGIGTTTPNAKLDINGNTIITGSLNVTQGITGSLFGTSSWAVSASWAPVATTVATASFVTASNVYGPFGSNSILSSSFAQTASFAPLYLPLTGGTITGNVTVNGTASIGFLNVQYESASVIYSSGSNVFGDATNDTQTLNGTVLVSGSQQITGSLNVTQGITGSLFGTASWAVSASWAPVQVSASFATTASYVLNAVSASFASTASFITGSTNAFVQSGNSFGTTATLGTNDNQSLALETSGSTRMFISSSGNVGIGTTSPSFRLSVSASSSSDGIQVIQFGTSRIVLTGEGVINWGSAADFGRLTWDTGKAILQGQSGKALSLGANNLSDHLYINTSGNVGIGTTSPTSKLQSNNASTYNSTTPSGAIIASNLSNGNAVVDIGVDSALLGYIQSRNITSTTSYNLLLNPIGGNVGIGTTTPNYKLHVTGSGTSGSFSANGVLIVSGSNVGIGTTSPSARLDVSGSAIISGSFTVTPGTVREFQVNTTGVDIGNIITDSHTVTGSLSVSGSITGSLFGTASFASTASFLNGGTNAFIQSGNSFGTTATLGTNDNQSLALETSGSTRMFISSSGNVGIGVTSPTRKLDVAGEINATDYRSTDTLFLTADGDNAGSNPIVFRNGPSGELARITSAGNVGIGTTSPGYPLSIENTSEFLLTYKRTGGTSKLWGFGADNSSTYFKNLTDSTIAYTVTNGGNVGIGTTTPNAKLDVSGSAIISGSFTVTPGTVREFQVRTTGVDIGNVITDTHTVTGSLSTSGSLTVNGNTIITGSLAVSQSLLQYSNITAVTSGSTSNVASFNTSSYTAAFFDYVASSNGNARAGSVFTVWNGNSVEYTETSTNDIGNTNNLLLSASVTAGAVRLQATSLSGSWSVKTLARML